jgi:uncharacterized phage-associated protein
MSEIDKSFKLDIRKAIEAVIYVASKAPIPDIYHVGKAFYFADKDHLELYGRLICGDRYIAMEAGPVPSAVYDLIKDVRDHRNFSRVYRQALESFSVSKEDHMVKPLREPKLDCLSESDIECLNRAIEQIGKLPFGELKELSHDGAYLKADRNDDISLTSIIDTLPSSESLKRHISDSYLG